MLLVPLISEQDEVWARSLRPTEAIEALDNATGDNGPMQQGQLQPGEHPTGAHPSERYPTVFDMSVSEPGDCTTG